MHSFLFNLTIGGLFAAIALLLLVLLGTGMPVRRAVSMAIERPGIAPLFFLLICLWCTGMGLLEALENPHHPYPTIWQVVIIVAAWGMVWLSLRLQRQNK
jgi:hypothetical protein